jgi:hypothetical protein
MTTSTSGLLLILLGVVVLSGFLTGNLDRWMGYLFDPGRPGLGPVSSPSSSSTSTGYQRAGGPAATVYQGQVS